MARARASRLFGLAVVVVAAGVLTGAGGTPQGIHQPTVVAQPAPAVADAPVAAPPVVVPPAPIAVPPPPPPPAPSATPCGAAARACFKLSTNQGWLVGADGSLYGPVAIRHGGPGHRTPTGTFRVQFHSKHHRSTLYSLTPMPNAVFFNGNIAMHQGPLNSQSHGCVRLSQGASLTFFNALRRGDVVQVIR